MSQDPIADFLTRLRNAQAARREAVELPSSNMKLRISKILEAEGYVEGVSERAEGPKRILKIVLKYDHRSPKIRSIRRVSKPGLRVYRKANELPRVMSDFGLAIVSTSAGVMTNKEARRRKLGGEVLCEIT
jgi:small subunit ribosomal protein S8